MFVYIKYLVLFTYSHVSVDFVDFIGILFFLHSQVVLTQVDGAVVCHVPAQLTNLLQFHHLTDNHSPTTPHHLQDYLQCQHLKKLQVPLMFALTSTNSTRFSGPLQKEEIWKKCFRKNVNDS